MTLKCVKNFSVFFRCASPVIIGFLIILTAGICWAADACASDVQPAADEKGQETKPIPHFFDASAGKLPFEKKAEESKQPQGDETVSAETVTDEIDKVVEESSKEVTEKPAAKVSPPALPETELAKPETKTEPAPTEATTDAQPAKTKEQETESTSAETAADVQPAKAKEQETPSAQFSDDNKEKMAAETEAAQPGSQPSEKASAESMKIRVNIGNVRDNASLKAKINAQLQKGDAVSILERKGEWFQVQLQSGETGWIHSSILSEPGDASVSAAPPKEKKQKKKKVRRKTVRVNKGNIRQSASLKAKIITQLKKGDQVSVTGREGDWYQVSLSDGKSGWAHQIIFTAKKKAQKKFRLIKGIRIDPVSSSEEKVSIYFNGENPPKCFLMDGNPVRVVCDFQRTRLGKEIKRKNPVNESLIKRIRTYSHEKEKQNQYARVVFDLNDDREYHLNHSFVKGRAFVITIKTER